MSAPLRLSHIFAAALVCGVAALALSATSAGAQSASPLARYRGHNRVLVIFAPSMDDVRFRKQLQLLNGQEAEESDRDLVRLWALVGWQKTMPFGMLSEEASRALRRKYQVRPGQFRVLLIGKDGNAAYSQASPVEPSELFARIDRMPMRREEMRRRKQP